MSSNSPGADNPTESEFSKEPEDSLRSRDDRASFEGSTVSVDESLAQLLGGGEPLLSSLMSVGVSASLTLNVESRFFSADGSDDSEEFKDLLMPFFESSLFTLSSDVDTTEEIDSSSRYDSFSISVSIFVLSSAPFVTASIAHINFMD